MRNARRGTANIFFGSQNFRFAVGYLTTKRVTGAFVTIRAQRKLYILVSELVAGGHYGLVDFI